MPIAEAAWRSAGLGDHLDRLVPGLAVELVYGPAAERAEQVRDGRLDATFVRGTLGYPGLRRVPAWQEPLFVALSARHPLAGEPEVRLADLAPFALRLTERRNNTPLVDLVVRACHEAGFAPVPAPVAAVLTDSLAMNRRDRGRLQVPAEIVHVWIDEYPADGYAVAGKLVADK